MAIVLLSFATREFKLSQKVLALSGRLMGVDRCIQKSEADLQQTIFYQRHQAILCQKRGAGYWLWKPYFILESLKELQDGDILIYADAGVLIWRKISPLAALVSQGRGVGLFYNDSLMQHYTKRDVFIALDCDEERYHNAVMIHAGLQAYRKCPEAISFLEEVLRVATTDELITDASNKLGEDNLPGFIEHRHDQSIFALVAHKREMTINMDPSQFRVKKCLFRVDEGDLYQQDAPYSSIVYFHRYKNNQLHCLIFDVVKKIYGTLLSHL